MSCIQIVFLIFSIMPINAIALTTKEYTGYFDIYGVSEKEEEALLKQNSNTFKEFIRASLPDINNVGHIVDDKKAKLLHDEIINSLKKTQKYLFVKLTNIIYPKKKSLYVTLDLVRKKDVDRIKFNAKPTRSIVDKSGLIKKWIEYEDKGWSMMYAGNADLYLTECPALHCLFGFDKPEFKKYLPIFNQVNKHVDNVCDILYNDKSSKKRASAALLLGHLKSSDRIVTILTPSLNDYDSTVRNNALRVVLTSLLKDDKASVFVPIEKLIKGVDDPAAEDRGKSLAILISLISKTKKYNSYIKEHSGDTLIKLLKLKQLSNHESAYEILKLISNKNYSDSDIKSWRKWVYSKSI